jgi:ribosomal protein L13
VIAKLDRLARNVAFCSALMESGCDFVAVDNPHAIRYFNHSQYAGGWRNLSVAQVSAKRPDYPVRHAINGMLPKNPLGRAIGSKLFVYAGDKHPHAAQKPEAFDVRKA